MWDNLSRSHQTLTQLLRYLPCMLEDGIHTPFTALWDKVYINWDHNISIEASFIKCKIKSYCNSDSCTNMPLCLWCGRPGSSLPACEICFHSYFEKCCPCQSQAMSIYDLNPPSFTFKYSPLRELTYNSKLSPQPESPNCFHQYMTTPAASFSMQSSHLEIGEK